MSITINSAKRLSKLLLCLAVCFAFFQVATTNSTYAATKHGKTGTYNGKLYIAHEDIPGYMAQAKNQIDATIAAGSKNWIVKAINLPSVLLKKAGLTKWPSSLTIAKGCMWAGYYATYAEVKIKDKGNGIYFDSKSNIYSQ